MDVDVERLRLEILLSQSAPSPQYDLSPQRSPAVGTGSHEPGVPRAETQSTEREKHFLLQASVDVFLDVSCKSSEQGTTILLQADVGVDDAEITTTNAQAAAREAFARTSKNRKQQRMVAV